MIYLLFINHISFFAVLYNQINHRTSICIASPIYGITL